MRLTTTEHGETIKAALERGESYRTIAAILGCSKDTVNSFVRDHFPEHRRQPSNPEFRTVPQEPMRILLIDIETRPNLAYVWSIWQQNVSLDQLLESVEMISWAAKWYGDPVIRFKSAHHDGREDMVNTAWQLLNQADAVMHYNGRRFDVPHLNREFLEAGLKPPSPFKQIDLLRTVRKQFNFPSYKLAYVSERLGLGGKAEHEGFKLWLRCMDGDTDAWNRMRDYNIQDVRLLEEVYEALLPWIVGHPSYGALRGENCCPNCGSSNLVADGTTITKIGQYEQLRCKNCGKWSRSTRRQGATELTEVTA